MHPKATGKASKYTDLTLAILRKEAGLGGDQATSSTRLPTLEKNSSTTALPITEELARLEFRKYFQAGGGGGFGRAGIISHRCQLKQNK
jgi:hypothetical protein